MYSRLILSPFETRLFTILVLKKVSTSSKYHQQITKLQCLGHPY